MKYRIVLQQQYGIELLSIPTKLTLHGIGSIATLVWVSPITNRQTDRQTKFTLRWAIDNIDPFLSILVAMVFILEVKPSRPVSQFQVSLTKLSALLQVGVQFRYNVEL